MADAPPPDRDDLIARFCAFATSAEPEEAEYYLAASRWDVQVAIESFFASQEDDDSQSETAEDPLDTTGGRSGTSLSGQSLAGRATPPSAIPTTSSIPPAVSSAARKKAVTKKFATLGDINKDEDDNGPRGKKQGSPDDDDGRQDFFAGGEKSGLAVQGPSDPTRSVRDILKNAKKNMPRPGGDPSPERPSHFAGTGVTLGGDDTPSQVIPGAQKIKQPEETKHRTLHFWTDGFSVEDGALYRFDDPANAQLLAQIRAGSAPLSILPNIESGDAVDLKVEQHPTQFVQPKKKWKPFSGGGQRLGSPTPAARSTAPEGATAAIASIGAATTAPPAAATVNVDESQPIISLQIRLGDGTRLASRFNPTHTIGDVYSFVNTSNPASAERTWVLMTTFPSKELTDKSVALGDLPEFKRGGVVVQKWT